MGGVERQFLDKLRGKKIRATLLAPAANGPTFVAGTLTVVDDDCLIIEHERTGPTLVYRHALARVYEETSQDATVVF